MFRGMLKVMTKMFPHMYTCIMSTCTCVCLYIYKDMYTYAYTYMSYTYIRTVAVQLHTCTYMSMIHICVSSHCMVLITGIGKMPVWGLGVYCQKLYQECKQYDIGNCSGSVPQIVQQVPGTMSFQGWFFKLGVRSVDASSKSFTICALDEGSLILGSSCVNPAECSSPGMILYCIILCNTILKYTILYYYICFLLWSAVSGSPARAAEAAFVAHFHLPARRGLGTWHQTNCSNEGLETWRND